MTGYVYTHPGLPESELWDLFQTLGELAYALQETEVRIRFIRFSDIDALWDEGRAFGETLEVRWQSQTSEHSETSQVSKSYRLQVLSETPVETLQAWNQLPPMDTSQEQKLYLWGRHWSKLQGAQDNGKLPDAWTEALIPGLETLKYPLEPIEFAYIPTIDYRQNGITRLTRFKGLAGEPDQKEGVR